jgi:CheY-like chemotaxis protein
VCDETLAASEGLSLPRAIRATGSRIPVLLLSDDPHQPGADDDAVQGRLQKPILRSELYHHLRDLSAPPATAPTAADQPGRPMRVLAAEDNRTNQLVLRKMVQDFDIVLEFAGNGHEAVAMWRSFRPDLIFMDISMPEMDGREAARAIRDAEAATATHVPIVALTAHALEGDDQAILSAGIDEYLTKPLRKSALAQRIAAHCPAGARAPVPLSTLDPDSVPRTVVRVR